MKKATVFLDLDGVMVNWLDGMRKAANLPGSIFDGYRKDHRTLTPHNISPIFGGTEKLDALMEARPPEFWINLEMFPWAKPLFDKMKEHFEVVFLTSPGGCAVACQGKWTWKKTHFAGTSMILTRDKFYCAGPGKVLIDDDQFQLTRFDKAGGLAIEWPNQFRLEKLSVTQMDYVIDSTVAAIKLYEKSLT